MEANSVATVAKVGGGNRPAAGLSAGETGHDRLPQVGAQGLGFNKTLPGVPGRHFQLKCRSRCALLDIYFSKDLQN